MDSIGMMGFIPTRDAKMAKPFYAGVLGFRVLSEDDFALVLDSNGAKVRVTKVDDFTPQPFTILGWEVGDIDRVVSGLAGKGVQFERFGLKDQDPQGIWKSPSGARVAWFKDPDGNLLSLTQSPR